MEKALPGEEGEGTMPCRAATHFPGTVRRAQVPRQQGAREAADILGRWGGLQGSWATWSSGPKGCSPGMGQGDEWGWGLPCLHGELQA